MTSRRSGLCIIPKTCQNRNEPPESLTYLKYQSHTRERHMYHMDKVYKCIYLQFQAKWGREMVPFNIRRQMAEYLCYKNKEVPAWPENSFIVDPFVVHRWTKPHAGQYCGRCGMQLFDDSSDESGDDVSHCSSDDGRICYCQL